MVAFNPSPIYKLNKQNIKQHTINFAFTVRTWSETLWQEERTKEKESLLVILPLNSLGNKMNHK